jgi:hypothetical protein
MEKRIEDTIRGVVTLLDVPSNERELVRKGFVDVERLHDGGVENLFRVADVGDPHLFWRFFENELEKVRNFFLDMTGSLPDRETLVGTYKGYLASLLRKKLTQDARCAACREPFLFQEKPYALAFPVKSTGSGFSTCSLECFSKVWQKLSKVQKLVVWKACWAFATLNTREFLLSCEYEKRTTEQKRKEEKDDENNGFKGKAQ